jgi:hypothetical protein
MELIEHSIGNVQVLSLKGSFDTYHAQSVRQWLEQATESDPARVVVNLQDVSFLDSTGLIDAGSGHETVSQIEWRYPVMRASSADPHGI